MARPMIALWSLYDNPSDFPGKAVARKFVVGVGVVLATNEEIVCDTLDDLRRALTARGLYFWVNRQHDDDPSHKETWL